MKAQGCAIGTRVAFLGTGPLLYLVAYQYARAGAQVAAVLDTTPFATKAAQAFGLMRGGATFAKGLYYIGWLRAHDIPIFEGVTPLAIGGDGQVESLSWRDMGGDIVIGSCATTSLRDWPVSDGRCLWPIRARQ
ncbi:hypothetical protein ACVWYH_007181 [Bradyrhizobium sp. GM24.11]